MVIMVFRLVMLFQHRWKLDKRHALINYWSTLMTEHEMWLQFNHLWKDDSVQLISFHKIERRAPVHSFVYVEQYVKFSVRSSMEVVFQYELSCFVYLLVSGSLQCIHCMGFSLPQLTILLICIQLLHMIIWYAVFRTLRLHSISEFFAVKPYRLLQIGAK